MSTNPRRCFYIPIDAYVEGRGYRVSVVTENEPGHCPTGVWPNDGTREMPYFWGHDYKEAMKICDRQNERMGISRTDAMEIVASSIGAQSRQEGGMPEPAGA